MNRVTVAVSVNAGGEPLCLLRRSKFPKPHLAPFCGGQHAGEAKEGVRRVRNLHTVRLLCHVCQMRILVMRRLHNEGRLDGK